MKDFTLLKQSIIEAIRENGVGAITGNIAQEQMLLMVDAMELSEVVGIATPNTEPITDTKSNHVYFAVQSGDYSAFVEGLSLSAGDCYIFIKPADSVEWSAVNLTDGLMSAISAIAESKQDALTQGDGIIIDGTEISVITTGVYLVFEDGKLSVSASEDYDEWEARLATGRAVAAYIDSLVGDTIAPLDNEQKVPKENMQDDVAYFDEETAEEVDEQLVDEYDRTLRKAYAAIGELKTAQRHAENATAQLIEALHNVSSAIEASETATGNANTAAEEVRKRLSDVQSAIDSAYAATIETRTAIIEAGTATDIARQASSQVVSSGEFAQTWGEYAKNKGDYANEKAGLADSKAEYAKDQGDYAKDKGDYAKDQGDAATEAIDEAKGSYPTMNDRFESIEGTIIEVVDEDDPTTILS